MMTILAWMMIAVLVAYVGYITWKFGVLETFSAGYYKLIEGGGIGIFFTAFAWSLCVLIALFGVMTQDLHAILEFGVSEIDLNILWTFGVASIGAGMLGAAPNYRKKQPGVFHNIGAALIILGCLLGIGMIFHNWLPLYISVIYFVVSLITKKYVKINNRTYWEELLVALVIFGGFLAQ